MDAVLFLKKICVHINIPWLFLFFTSMVCAILTIFSWKTKQNTKKIRSYCSLWTHQYFLIKHTASEFMLMTNDEWRHSIIIITVLTWFFSEVFFPTGVLPLKPLYWPFTAWSILNIISTLCCSQVKWQYEV